MLRPHPQNANTQLVQVKSWKNQPPLLNVTAFPGEVLENLETCFAFPGKVLENADAPLPKMLIYSFSR